MGKRPVGDCRSFFVKGGMEIFSPGWRNARNRSPHPVKRIRGGRSLQMLFAPFAQGVQYRDQGLPPFGEAVFNLGGYLRVFFAADEAIRFQFPEG